MAHKPNLSLIKQAVVAAEANRRQSTSHVKTRGEVRGGGRKPWKQKGTGRARAGTTRSPLWVGGGIVFGPSKERNYKQDLPKKMAKKAVEELFAIFTSENRLKVVDSLGLKEAKTKAVIELLTKHDALNKRVLMLTNEVEAELVLASRNIQGVEVVASSNMSILQLAHADLILIEKKAAETRGLATPSAEKPKAPVAKKAASEKAKKTTKKESK